MDVKVLEKNFLGKKYYERGQDIPNNIQVIKQIIIFKLWVLSKIKVIYFYKSPSVVLMFSI